MLSAASHPAYTRLLSALNRISTQLLSGLLICLFLILFTLPASAAPNETPAQPWLFEKLFAIQDRLSGIEKSQLTTVELDAVKSTVIQLSSQLDTLRHNQVTQTQLDTLTGLVTTLDKEIVRIDQAQQAQSNRVADVGTYATVMGVIMGVFGVIITVAAIVLGFTAKNRAVDEAKQASQKAIDDWINANLKNKVEDLEQQALAAFAATQQEHERKLSELQQGITQLIERSKSDIEKLMTRLKSTLPVTLEDDERAQIEQNSIQIRIRPESEYSVDDWSSLFIEAYYATDYEKALGYLDKVLNDERALPTGITAKTLFRKGVTLSQLERSNEVIAVYDELLSRFGDTSEPELQELVAKALLNKGAAVSQLNHFVEEIDVYNELISQFGDTEVPALKEPVACAFLNKGISLSQLDKDDKAIAAYDELLKRFSETKVVPLQKFVVDALLNKGICLGRLGCIKEEISAYNVLLNSFGDTHVPALQELVAKTLINKGACLGQLDHSESAITVYDELLNRFGEADTQVLQEQVAKALFNKGIRLGLLDRSNEEITTYDTLLNRFGNTDVPTLQELVTKALVNKGYLLFERKNFNESITTSNSAIARFSESESTDMLHGIALSNKAEAQTALGLSEEALETYQEFIKRYADSDDEEIKELIDKAQQEISKLQGREGEKNKIPEPA